MNDQLVGVDGNRRALPNSPDQRARPRRAIALIVALVLVPLVVLVLAGSLRSEEEQPRDTDTDELQSNAVTVDEQANSGTFSTNDSVTLDEGSADPDEPAQAPMPVLDQATGLEIWVGGDSRVTRIDLDTGQRLQIDRRGYPLVASGAYLVMFERVTDSFLVINRLDPSKPVVALDAGSDFEITTIAESPLPGGVWAADDSGPLVAWRLLSLETGAPLRTASTESLQLMTIADRVHLAHGPELDVREDEVWRLDGAEHGFWFVGRVIARDTTVALVENCDATCRTEWRDISSGERIERPVPPDLLDIHELLGAGTWIYARTNDLSQSTFVDTATFSQVDTKTRRRTRPFDIEDTGRWAAMTGSQRVWILDLGTGEETPIPGGRSLVGASASVVFATRST